MKRYSRSKPMYYLIDGTNIKKATFMGVRQWLTENNKTSVKVFTVQDGEIVNHPSNGTIVYAD